MAGFDQNLIIVIRPALQTIGNEMAMVADPTTDANTFTLGLRNASDNSAEPAVVAYFCSWVMTQEQRDRLIAEFGKRVGKAITPIPVGGRVRKQDNYWLFEALPGQWEWEQVKAALGMENMPAGGDA